jgi:hypothetical protein
LPGRVNFKQILRGG